MKPIVLALVLALLAGCSRDRSAAAKRALCDRYVRQAVGLLGPAAAKLTGRLFDGMMSAEEERRVKCVASRTGNLEDCLTPGKRADLKKGIDEVIARCEREMPQGVLKVCDLSRMPRKSDMQACAKAMRKWQGHVDDEVAAPSPRLRWQSKLPDKPIDVAYFPEDVAVALLPGAVLFVRGGKTGTRIPIEAGAAWMAAFPSGVLIVADSGAMSFVETRRERVVWRGKLPEKGVAAVRAHGAYGYVLLDSGRTVRVDAKRCLSGARDCTLELARLSWKGEALRAEQATLQVTDGKRRLVAADPALVLFGEDDRPSLRIDGLELGAAALDGERLLLADLRRLSAVNVAACANGAAFRLGNIPPTCLTWSAEHGKDASGSVYAVIPAGDGIVVQRDDGLALIRQGTRVWSTEPRALARPVVQGTMLLAVEEGEDWSEGDPPALAARSLEDGKLLWRLPLPGPTRTKPPEHALLRVAGGHALVGYLDRVYVVPVGMRR